MNSDPNLVIAGASARAAAMSALRAGFRPWCVDLFGDRDLALCCSVHRLSQAAYSRSLPATIRQAPSGPWMYTGALENSRRTVATISTERTLWGNNAEGLRCIRSPSYLAELYRAAGIQAPRVRREAEGVDQSTRWLIKPLRGAGGGGIRYFVPANVGDFRKGEHYLQEWIEGESISAVYVAVEGTAKYLGATRQLVGQEWLHARPFQYCGNVGPLLLPLDVESQLKRIGNVVSRHCRLKGLFGVDLIRNGTTVWPVEVNPRYTASVEVYEFATGQSLFLPHAGAFGYQAMNSPHTAEEHPRRIVGKAVYYADKHLTFPSVGPWDDDLSSSRRVDTMPRFADIPNAKETIGFGHPILTILVAGESPEQCLAMLCERAAELDQLLCAQ